MPEILDNKESSELIQKTKKHNIIKIVLVTAMLLFFLIILGIVSLLVFNSKYQPENTEDVDDINPDIVVDVEDFNNISSDDNVFLVYCPEKTDSEKNCILKKTDGTETQLQINGGFELENDFAYRFKGDKLEIYKFNGADYVKLQDYKMEFPLEYNPYSFVTEDYIYVYTYEMKDLDGIPQDLSNYNAESFFENDVEGNFIRYGVSTNKYEVIKNVKILQAWTLGDTFGEAYYIHEVDEKNNTLYYSDPMGGGFFSALIKYNWIKNEEETIEFQDASFFSFLPKDKSYIIYESISSSGIPQLILNNFKSSKILLDSESIISTITSVIPDSDDVLIMNYSNDNKEYTIYKLIAADLELTKICSVPTSTSYSSNEIAYSTNGLYLFGLNQRVSIQDGCTTTDLPVINEYIPVHLVESK